MMVLQRLHTHDHVTGHASSRMCSHVSPQSRVPPQPSSMVPHGTPSAAQVVGVQLGPAGVE